MSVVVRIDDQVQARARQWVLAWMKEAGEDVTDEALVRTNVLFFVAILHACTELFAGRGALVEDLGDVTL